MVLLVHGTRGQKRCCAELSCCAELRVYGVVIFRVTVTFKLTTGGVGVQHSIPANCSHLPVVALVWLHGDWLKLNHVVLCVMLPFAQVVDGSYAFVLHTANPLTGRLGEMFGELVPGLGEVLVRGKQLDRAHGNGHFCL